MVCRLRLFVGLSLLVAALNASAQPAAYPGTNEAIAGLFPGEKVAEWTRTTGDFNGDGVSDVALMLTLFYDDAPLQTRLVVLAGARGGGYSVLSASARYCDAQKFFNLASKGASLQVSAVHKADASEMASETLQFRFNRELGDFELIGREDAWESYTHNSSGRLSVNYRTGQSIEYARERGRTREKRLANRAVARPARLHGFDCGDWMSRAAY